MSILTTAILALALNFSGGYIPQAGNGLYAFEDAIPGLTSEFFLEFGAELCYRGIFFIGGNLRAEKGLSHGYAGRRNLDKYSFSAGVRPAEWLEIGFRYYHTELAPPNFLLTDDIGVSADRQEIYVKIHAVFDIIK